MATVARFDQDVAIKTALALFWRRGFAATSTRDLQEALGLHPGSIYGAFGSKAGLYRAVLDEYTQQTERQLLRHIREQRSVVTGFKLFIRQMLLASDKQPAPACLLVKSALELADTEPALADHARARLKQIEALFAKQLGKARELGELSLQAEPGALAQQLQVLIMGLRSYRACGGDSACVGVIVDQLFVTAGG